MLPSEPTPIYLSRFFLDFLRSSLFKNSRLSFISRDFHMIHVSDSDQDSAARKVDSRALWSISEERIDHVMLTRNERSVDP